MMDDVGAITADSAPVVVPATGCAALPPRAFSVVVTTAAMLEAAVQSVPAGGVIGIADGTYDLSGGITIATPGLTLRSTSGDPTRVTLQGGAATTLTIVASKVTIADLTLQNATTMAVLVAGTAAADTLGVQLYDLIFANPGGPAIRILPFGGTVAGPFADDGTIACSQFLDTPALDNHCVGSTLGIDGEAARGWVVRDNAFSGLVCPNEYERAIIFRYGSRDTQVVRNRLKGSNMNISFGFGAGNSRTYADASPIGCAGVPDHIGGLICDNVIDGQVLPPMSAPDFDTGIGLWSACDTWVMHNTVVSPAAGETYHDIEYRFMESYVHLVNNLTEQAPASRDSGVADLAYLGSNVTYMGPADFASAMTGDFHLVPSAPEMPGTAIAATNLCETDADGKARNLAQPTPGAYER